MENVKIKFQVLRTDDPKELLIADTSRWSFIYDKPSIIEITLPGYSNPIVHYFEKDKINNFTSASLGINCGAECEEDLVDLPDGIYYIVVKGSPDTFKAERYYLRTEKLQLSLDLMFIKLGLDINNEESSFVDALLNAKMLIEASHSATRLGNIKKAYEYYKEAKRLVDNLNCN